MTCQHQALKKTMKEGHKFHNCSVPCGSTWVTALSWHRGHAHMCACRSAQQGRSPLGSRGTCAWARSLEGDQDMRLCVEMLQHSSMPPGWSQLPARANLRLSLLVCVDTHLIIITASRSKFLSFVIFLLVLQEDTAGALINEEKGLLALQGIYVTVSFSAQVILCATPHGWHP